MAAPRAPSAKTTWKFNGKGATRRIWPETSEERVRVTARSAWRAGGPEGDGREGAARQPAAGLQREHQIEPGRAGGEQSDLERAAAQPSGVHRDKRHSAAAEHPEPGHVGI